MELTVNRLRESTLKAYEARPALLREHYGIEQVVLAGGYGYRQVMELVQNGADAVLEACEQGNSLSSGNIVQVILRGSRLYVANTGAPLSEEGIDALMSSHSSPKRGNQIGRFGLGFKSLLRLGGCIDLFTRSCGAVRFDPERCRRELRERFGVTEVPGLRLAWSLDESERAADPLLADLAWAETIVRAEIKTADMEAHLRQEISAFPAEFLLFLPVSLVLELDDGEKPPRTICAKPNGVRRILRIGAEESLWQVVCREVAITDVRARADATHIHAREKVPVAWAVPLDAKREEAGRFWAFFPTHTPTYLPGIVNAPWKLNSDRNAIIGGEWNSALMYEAARLIVETLPTLSTPEDPGRPLDAFPRQLARTDEDAAPLVEAVWKALESAAAVPNAAGKLRPALKLWRHPLDDADIANQWQRLAKNEQKTELVHPSCYERQRGSRLNALAERLAARGTQTPHEPVLRKQAPSAWFAAVASTELARAVEVLKLAAAYADHCLPWEWSSQVRPTLAIILTDRGKLVTANQAVFAPEGTRVPDGRHPVARVLCEQAEARRIITEVMKVKPLDESVWLDVLREALRGIPDSPADSQDKGWLAFWNLLRKAPPGVAQEFITENGSQVQVRRNDGQWVPQDEVLLPGELVSAEESSSNKNVLVDPAVHATDIELLKRLGVSDFPKGKVTVRDCLALDNWLRHWRAYYRRHVDGRARWDYLKPSRFEFPKGWLFLPKLIGPARAKLTAYFIDQLGGGEFPESVQFGHSSVRSYPEIHVPHPLPWFLLQHGVVQVGDYIVCLAAILARRHEPALAKLPVWTQLKLALEKHDGVEPQVRATEKEIQALWHALIKLLATDGAVADDSLQALWSGAAKDGIVPETLPSATGAIPLSQVFVSGSPDLARRARTNGRIVVTLDNETLQLWLNKGAQNLESLMFPEWTQQIGPAALLVFTVPELAEVMQSEVKDTARCQPVAGLKLNIAGQAEPVPCLMWQNCLFLDLAELSKWSRAERLRHLLAEVAPAGWLMYTPEEALRILGDAQVDALRARVAGGNTLAERLLLAVGNRREPLEKALGGLAGMEFIRQCQPLQLAELILAQLGPATLVTLKDALKDEGLKPPSRWNSAEARAFVASIGFPEEFAASAEGRREPEEIISGPIDLPPLHDFQEEILAGIKTLLKSNQGRRRAVISLPTGGGKTRVTVEAAVLLVLKPEGEQRSVLWVAQTDELCEQAVQAFRQVWINLGAQRTNLRIIRFWGGHPDPAAYEPGKPVVVIASIQTLQNRMGGTNLEWLQKPGLVVVDECHHAITPSYTNLLRWLDAEAPRFGQPPKEEPPILGLSATPFRTDDEESRRLARRFDQRWLPPDQQNLHRKLLVQGVLAKVIAEPLDSGVAVSEDLLDELMSLLDSGGGPDFERQLENINQSLARNEQRNERLVARIKSAEEKSILFFANSVLHAEEMSARLNLERIPAAAVSGKTAPAARRYFLERYQRGEIRVLCNHTVLSTGFDAPKTDMILIARQVFSPVRYMQMVGRGLRGPKNGGTETCRIVTVLDNLGRFQDRHPYHYCQRYFSTNM
ncbi:MAG: DEAD/DEAH box helicase [Verrucomicrobiae bacterium]|nr:DEAD/DEAH box helicase [Verrucomicrobiae bacterium]